MSALLAVGCGTETSTSRRPAAPELTEHRACGSQFWAATADGDVALRITLENVDRSTTEATTIDVTVPDSAVTIEVLRGRDLTRNFCTDALDMASEPTFVEPATSGAGQIVLAPTEPSCGTLDGSVSLAEVVAEDGTTFAPISFKASGPVCYGG